jgi:putative heme-binding domain-containing protein
MPMRELGRVPSPTQRDGGSQLASFATWARLTSGGGTFIFRTIMRPALLIALLGAFPLVARPADVAPSLVTRGLIGHWKFDGTGKDTSARAAHGEILGTPGFTDTSLGGKYIRLNGRDAAVRVPAVKAPSVAEGGFSVACFVRPSKNAEQTILSQIDANGTGWRLLQTKTMGIRLETTGRAAAVNSNIESPANVLANGRWGHVVVAVNRSVDGGFARLYINARHLGDGKILAFDMQPADLMIGAGDGRFFNGSLDELYLFDRQISEMKTLFAPGSRFDYEPLAKDKFSRPQEIPGRVSGTPNPVNPPGPFADGEFALKEDDVVAFVGAGNLEAAQKYGHLETILTATYPNHRLRFRNVAWEGDTVYEQWRDVNFGAWTEQLGWLKASVLMVQFGQMESLDGVGKLTEFIAAYGKLLDQFEKQTKQIVLVSPRPFENPPAKLAPKLAERNRDVAAYAKAIRQLAARRKLLFVDLMPVRPDGNITRDGIHLTPEAHEHIDKLIAEQLGMPASPGISKPGLRELIQEKNRLWFDYWRPMNYAFAFGDRMHVPFGQGDPTLRDELEVLRPFLETAEARIDAHVSGAGSLPKMPAIPTRKNSEIAFLTPEEELASFTLQGDLQANLFASEADGIVNPVQMRWDERGRLWVLCLPTYPQVLPGAKPNDYILVCEDTDQDGRADKFHRFAEGLHMPMGLELGDGGLYVGHGSELIHLRDTDGDGKADQRRIVLSGFGTGDSHQLINSLTWGPNGRLWFTQGHHVYSRVETPWGIEKHLKAGVWRLHPNRLKADNFFEKSTAGANCWGVAFDEWGQVFHNTGDAYAAFYTVPGMIRTDHPRRTISLFTDSKNMCIEIIGTKHLPENLQKTVVFAGYYNNSVPVYRTEPDGSGYKTVRLPELITSTRREFRPVDIRVGPDGGLYLCDWYNEIVGHYQASYRDPRRDQRHGRIWRITSKSRPLVKQPDLASMNAVQLREQLRSGERWTHYQAKRLLFAKSTDEVARAFGKLNTEDLPLLYREIGVLEAHGIFKRRLMNALLDSSEPGARGYGVRMIGNWAAEIPDALDLLERFIRDDHPQVRLETIVAATYVGSPRAMEIAVKALDAPMDKFLDYALRQSVHALAVDWKPAFTSGQVTFGGRSKHAAFVLQEEGSKDIAGQLKTLAATESLDRNARVNLLKLLANVGQPKDLRHVMDQGGIYPELLDELSEVVRVRGVIPAGNLLPSLTRGIMGESRGAVRLAGALKATSMLPRISGLARSSGTAMPVRVAAVEAFGALADGKGIKDLSAFVAADQPPPVRLAAVRALSRRDIVKAAKFGAKLLQDTKNEATANNILQPFLNHKSGLDALANELRQAKPTADAAKLSLRILAASGRDAPALRLALFASLGSDAVTPDYSAGLVAKLSAESESRGRAVRGEKVFASQIANCGACHKVKGKGGVQGPDLSAVGSGMTRELIIEAILWPKRQVKEGYLATTVTTKDDEYHQGYKTKDSAAELTLRSAATGREIRIAKKDIADITEAGTLMPEGLTAGMTHQELLDLVTYLSDLGRR